MFRTLMASIMAAAVFAIVAPLAASAAEGLQNEYQAKVIRNYDGDNITVEVSVWLDQVLTTSVRIDGINTPEIRGKCQVEKELAIKARNRTRELTAAGVTLNQVRWGKYAKRVVALVTLRDGRNLADVLIDEGHARPYSGGKRKSWCGPRTSRDTENN